MTTSIEESLRSGAVLAGPLDATPEMVAAALKVDWSNEDEEGIAHNVWHAMLSAAPDHTPALVALIEERDRLKVERDEARQIAYDLKYAAAGGEDAPGSAHAVTVADVDRWRREQWDVASSERTLRVAAEAKCDALREALALAEVRIRLLADSVSDPDARDAVIAQADEAARALTQEQPNVGE